MCARDFAQAAVRTEWSGVTLFVRSDDVDAFGKPAFVVRWQFSARGCVDQYGMWQMGGIDVVDKTLEVGGFRILTQLIAPLIEREVPVSEDHLAAVHDAADAQVYATMPLEFFNSSLKLAQQRATDQ